MKRQMSLRQKMGDHEAGCKRIQHITNNDKDDRPLVTDWEDLRRKLLEDQAGPSPKVEGMVRFRSAEMCTLADTSDQKQLRAHEGFIAHAFPTTQSLLLLYTPLPSR